MKSDRYTYLDLVRGLSAISVIIIHYRLFYAYGNHDMPTPPTLPFFKILYPIYVNGGSAVQVFWMLSGIVFFNKYSYEKMDLYDFAVRRLARLYPMHLFTLFLVSFIQIYSSIEFHKTQFYENNDLFHFMLQILMMSNWRHPLEFSFNGVIWSVSVEILIYIVFVCYMKLFMPSLSRTFMIFLFFLLIYITTRNLIVLCGATFFMGGIIILIWKSLTQKLTIPMGTVPIITVAVYVFLFQVSEIVFYFFTVPAILMIALTLDTLAPPVPVSARWIGDITYSLYLIHMPLMMIVKMWLSTQTNIALILNNYIFFLSWIFFVIAISVVLHNIFEYPMQQWIQRKLHVVQTRRSIDREISQTI